MNQRAKKKNSPRMQSAINRVMCKAISWRLIFRVHGISLVMYLMDIRDVGEYIMILAYGADKYDVLNRLCPGVQTSVITFARGDIRHRKRIDLAEKLAIIAVAIVAVILMLSPE